MNVHVALVGNKVEPILTGIRLYSAIDKLYLLHSQETKDKAQEIKIKLDAFGIKRIVFRTIDPFSMNSTVNAMTEIAKEESSNNIFVNITGGTNLMAGAACAASYFIGAQPYYVLDQTKLPNRRSKDLLVEIPVPKIPYHNALEQTQLKILQLIDNKGDKAFNKVIREEINMSPQAFSYNVKQLVKKNLIVMTTDEFNTRSKKLRLTDAGKLVFSWSKG
jgi:DNA-binding MarR family transcriptional regulator